MSLPVSAAFVSGFAVMSLELLEARLVAPYFGSSVLVWTNIIGVILVALALGAWAGGAAADRYPKLKTVAVFLFGAGLWSVALAVGGRVLLMSLAGMQSGIATPLASLILFAPPAFLLGAVAPAVLRLTVENVQHSGHAAGVLSAVGTIGSLFGTYVTGYLLLPHYSVSELFVGVGIVLVVEAFLLIERKSFFRSSAVLAVTGMVSVPSVFIGDRLVPGETLPSAYGHVAIADFDYRGASARALIINAGFHSAARPDSLQTSVFDYVTALQATDEFVADPKNMLLIGGGGMHVADSFLERHPDGQVDAIELDQAVYAAAEKAFGLRSPEKIRMVVDDARPAVARLTSEYDVIVGDAFGGDHCVPWQLLTREAMELYKKHLKAGGVFAINIIMPTETNGSAGRLFEARLDATLRTAFGWTIAVSTMNNDNAQDVANVIIFAGQGQKPDEAKLLSAIQEKYGLPKARLVALPEGGEPWTDDAGPADYESLAMYGEVWK